MPVDDYTSAFAGDADATTKAIGNGPARIVAHLDPRYLVGALDHPRGCVGGMVGLIKIIRRVKVDVSGIGVHLLTVGGCGGAACAIVFVVLKQDLLVRVADEIKRGHLRHVGDRKSVV